MIAMLLLATAAVAKDPKPLDEVLASIDKRTASRLIGSAGKAARLKQHATARRICERALQLDPENAGALTMLGYRRTRDGWERSREKQGVINTRKDADASKIAKARKDLVKAEEWRAREIARACVKQGAVEDERELLLSLLDRTPRVKEVHAALGHEKIGKRWVRPELAKVARSMDARIAAWRACGEIPRAPKPLAKGYSMLRLQGPLDEYPFEGYSVMSYGLGGKPGDYAAMTTCVYRFLALTLGGDKELAKDRRICFLDQNSYWKNICGIESSKEARKARYRYICHVYQGTRTFSVSGLVQARDYHGHSIVFYTLSDLLSRKDGGKFYWFKEGLSYLATLEMVGTADLHMVSSRGTGEKVRYTLPAPEEQIAKFVGPWLRANLEDGLCLPLADLCNTGINQLDFLASIQAYSFVRFLALWDAEAFKKFPAALQAAGGKNDRERTEAALKAVYGKGYRELEPLWRAFTLEIGLP